MLYPLQLSFRFLTGCCLYITLYLLILQIYSSGSNSVPPQPIPAASNPLFTPTIWELDISSNNNCNSSYAVDNDWIICTFTTMEPCFLMPVSIALFPSWTDSCTTYGSDNPPCQLFHPENDFRHWTCIYQIQNGDIPDQTRITARYFLEEIFHGNYRYYGSNPAVTYYAPIHYSFTLLPLEENITTLSANTNMQLEIISNHSIDFLPPETFKTDTGTYWSVSVIDQAGNGPCCITISLEDNCCLLYNFRHVRDNFYIFSFISQKNKQEDTYAGKSYCHCRGSSQRTD